MKSTVAPTFTLVPVEDTTDVLTESGGAVEHAPHGAGLRRVSAADGLVDAGSTNKPATQVDHQQCVPAADALIEAGGVVAHVSHIAGLRRVPGADALI